MDGELLATDTARFATLKKLVDIDLADRREWFGRAERNRAERFKRTNTRKPVYEGAPNLVDPIIHMEIFNAVDTELARRVMGLEKKAETEKKPEARIQESE